MPIYKVSKFERDEWRQRRRHGRLRLAAMVLSALLLLGTAALWLGRMLVHAPVPVVAVPAAKVLEGAAAVVPKLGR